MQGMEAARMPWPAACNRLECKPEEDRINRCIGNAISKATAALRAYRLCKRAIRLYFPTLIDSIFLKDLIASGFDSLGCAATKVAWFL